MLSTIFEGEREVSRPERVHTPASVFGERFRKLPACCARCVAISIHMLPCPTPPHAKVAQRVHEVWG